jgi:hypothetical protein
VKWKKKLTVMAYKYVLMIITNSYVERERERERPAVVQRYSMEAVNGSDACEYKNQKSFMKKIVKLSWL